MLPIDRTLSRLALAMLALPAGLGLTLCIVRPDRVLLWAVAMIAIPALLAATHGLRRFENALADSSEQAMQERGEVLSSAVAWASLVIALIMSARLAEALGLVDHALAEDMATRWANILAGGFLIFHGNRLPKILLPLSTFSDPARVQTVRRRTGLAYVLAGVAFAGGWLFLPVSLAQPAGLVILALGILAPALVMRNETRHCLSRRPPDIVGWP
jgi:hypothetical protein